MLKRFSQSVVPRSNGDMVLMDDYSVCDSIRCFMRLFEGGQKEFAAEKGANGTKLSQTPVLKLPDTHCSVGYQEPEQTQKEPHLERRFYPLRLRIRVYILCINETIVPAEQPRCKSH